MPNFFKSFFVGKTENPECKKQKNDKKNFEIFKYDGLRAQRIGRPEYAVKCFTEALNLEEDFDILGYLSQLYAQMGDFVNARKILNRMTELEPSLSTTWLTIANICFMQEDYHCMEAAAQKAIALEESNAVAYYLLAKATKGLGDNLMTVAHLTKSLTLKEDFSEALLLRAEVLLKMGQLTEARTDIDVVLTKDSDEEAAILLRGKISEAQGQQECAEADYKNIIDINPFNDQAYLYLGQLYITQKRFLEAISLFDEAIELNPNFGVAYHERGRAKLLNGDKDGSVEDMKKSLELNSKEGESLNGLFKNQQQKEESGVLGFIQ